MASSLGFKDTSNHLYLAWSNMRRRCTEKNTKDSYRYSERGISYCDEWESFDNFYRDMAETYRDGLSLDRVDNDGNYSPENCRWATPKEQANNTSRNRKITIEGITKNLSQWIDDSKVKSSTVRQRYYVYKWPIEKSLGLKLERGK